MRSQILIAPVLLLASIGVSTRSAQTLGERIEVTATRPHTEHLPNIWFEENSTRYLSDTGRYDFENSGILKSPDDVLDYMAKFLLENPSISELQVRGSADYLERGPDSLAMERARITCVNLTRRGVAANRLIPVSMGSNHPIIAEQVIVKLSTREEQRAARILNRTVYFFPAKTTKHDR